MPSTYLIAHDIRSVHNVGSLFRTADAAGVGRIFLSERTPQPLDRFGRKRNDISKVALGAEEVVPWEVYADIHTLLDTLHGERITTIALEQHETAQPYTHVEAPDAYALIVGSEVAGIPGEVLKYVNQVIAIPQYGTKESLNVSVAAGIALFSLRSRGE